jgi:hypothetical protein
MSNGRADRPAQRGPITEETAQRILAVTAKDLEIKGQELELRREELKHNSKFAETAIAAQASDRIDERNHKRKTARDRYLFAGALTLTLLAFAGYALYLNKDQIVIEALKILGPLVVGFGGGYFYGRSRPGKDAGAGDDPDAE